MKRCMGKLCGDEEDYIPSTSSSQDDISDVPDMADLGHISTNSMALQRLYQARIRERMGHMGGGREWVGARRDSASQLGGCDGRLSGRRESINQNDGSDEEDQFPESGPPSFPRFQPRGPRGGHYERRHTISALAAGGHLLELQVTGRNSRRFSSTSYQVNGTPCNGYGRRRSSLHVLLVSVIVK